MKLARLWGWLEKMSNVLSLKKQVQMLQQQFLPKPNEIVVVHMWLPDDDRRHGLTDAQILAEGYKKKSKVIVLPNREVTYNEA